MDSEVIKTVKLQKESVSGQSIIDAVKKIAGDEFKEQKRIVDDKIHLLIGRSSQYPYADLAISTTADYSVGFIDPNGLYETLAVVHRGWPGPKYAVGYNDNSINNSMEKFRDELEQEINR